MLYGFSHAFLDLVPAPQARAGTEEQKYNLVIGVSSEVGNISGHCLQERLNRQIFSSCQPKQGYSRPSRQHNCFPTALLQCFSSMPVTVRALQASDYNKGAHDVKRHPQRTPP